MSFQVANTINVFILAMLKYPEVQRKAQTLLDQAIDSDRLPTIDDRSRVPYIEAIMKETIRYDLASTPRPCIVSYVGMSRWRPISPLGKSSEMQRSGPPP